MDEEDEYSELIVPAGVKEGDLIREDGLYYVVGLILENVEVEDGFVAVIGESISLEKYRVRKIDEIFNIVDT